MGGEALSMLDRAQRLHRQFFTHAAVAWEPPVDIVETGDGALQMHIALPGVSADAITVALDPAGISISALRAFPCREESGQIHRLEIPYGRFERYIGLPLGDPYAPLELVGKSLADGILTLTFRKKEGA
jgi:HSP20 family molecular chaperone IbpA